MADPLSEEFEWRAGVLKVSKLLQGNQVLLSKLEALHFKSSKDIDWSTIILKLERGEESQEEILNPLFQKVKKNNDSSQSSSIISAPSIHTTHIEADPRAVKVELEKIDMGGRDKWISKRLSRRRRGRRSVFLNFFRKPEDSSSDEEEDNGAIIVPDEMSPDVEHTLWEFDNVPVSGREQYIVCLWWFWNARRKTAPPLEEEHHLSHIECHINVAKQFAHPTGVCPCVTHYTIKSYGPRPRLYIDFAARLRTEDDAVPAGADCIVKLYIRTKEIPPGATPYIWAHLSLKRHQT